MTSRLDAQIDLTIAIPVCNEERNLALWLQATGFDFSPLSGGD